MTTPPDARNALAEIVAQIEWLKSRLAYLQLPANSQKSIDEWLAECGMPPASIEAVEAEHRMEITDMADHFRAVNVERVFAQMKPDTVELIARANASQDRISALEAQVEGMRVALEMISVEAKEDNEPIGRSVFKALKTCGDIADIAIRAALQSSETTGEQP